MALPKFIITMAGYLRLGMVNLHKDLLIGDDQCIGGGYYQFDWASNRLLLDRASYDFGRPRWHLLDTLKFLLPIVVFASSIFTTMTSKRTLT